MSDAELINATLSGDRKAFGELIARYQAMVFATCLRLAGSVPDAEDLAHDSLVEAFVKLRQLRDPERFGGWLKTLTLNVFRMWYRAHGKQPIEVPDDIAAQDDEADDESLQTKINTCLFRLVPTHRVVLVLHYLEQLSYEEIARFLDVPMGTVMSRLHRGRQALRALVRDQTKDGIPMATQETVTQDVMAEITVLLEIFRDNPESLERLSIILDRSPERLTQLLEHAEDPEVTQGLGRLLPRLGGPAIRAVLDACFSGGGASKANALGALEVTVKNPGTHDAETRWGSPDPRLYILADEIIRHPAPPPEKAGLIVHLLRSVNEKNAGHLLECAILALQGTPALMEEYRRALSSSSLFKHRHVASAILRTGNDFLAEALQDVTSADGARTGRALAALMSFTQGIDIDWWCQQLHGSNESPEQFAQVLRHWPMVRSSALRSDLLGSLRTRIAELARNGSPRVRESAVQALGGLGGPDDLPLVLACLSDPLLSIRIAAIRALSDMGEPASSGPLIDRAVAGESTERVAAIEALGRMQSMDARDALLQLVEDPVQDVQVSAVIALGELGGDDVVARLTELRATGTIARKRAINKALNRNRKPAPPVPLEVQERQRILWEKLRGGKTNIVAHISISAALRYSFPQIRSYTENEVTHGIARYCGDTSAVRRLLIEKGFMTRENGIYEFTVLGQAAWRVERFIDENYLRPASLAGTASD